MYKGFFGFHIYKYIIGCGCCSNRKIQNSKSKVFHIRIIFIDLMVYKKLHDF